MASFFDKLRNSMGIEAQEEAEETKEKPQKEKTREKEPEEKAKKIRVKGVSPKEETPTPAAENQDWFEPEGELAVDVYQTEDDIVIQATIAGVQPEDLDISIENDVVTITGERRNTTEDQGKNYFYQECYWGAFSRQIILPEEIDANRADASMKDGVFTIRIPKLSRQKLRKIKVKG